jgi:hypothetical protein
MNSLTDPKEYTEDHIDEWRDEVFNTLHIIK